MQIKTVHIQFDKLMAETTRAYLLKFGYHAEYWFPKRFCWGMVVNSKLGGNVSIPTWLYMEKFGEEPNEDIADTIIEKHVPARIEPVQNMKPHASLIKPSAGQD